MSTDFLRPSQRIALEQDYAVAQASLNDPAIAPFIEDKARARKQANALKEALEKRGPQPFATTQEMNAAHAKEKELRDEWTEGMLSVEEMRRNRDGLAASTTMRHLKWEQGNKNKILEWKQLRARLDPTSDDPDLCNIERYRPTKAFVYDSTAQIAGHHAMSEQAKENWPDEMAEPKAKTAVSHFKKNG